MIAGKQSTKLVYNLVHRKDRGKSFERRGYWSRLCFRFGYRSGGGFGYHRGKSKYKKLKTEVVAELLLPANMINDHLRLQIGVC